MKIPVPVLNSGAADLDAFADAVKQNLDFITGQRKNSVKLLPLPATATLADVITRTNALLARIQ